ncbi:hypothetical protein [Flaviaesturariibacter amylovorans]|uniref:Uncharacterized protein n=1 Tax=Flaviaesturariibacter amylovorans TaxID=1084520 RepID=A0ABP8H4H3_9BACT
MRILLFTLLLLSSRHAQAQLPAGDYTQPGRAGRRENCVTLDLLADGTFYFNDMRSSSCWFWFQYLGAWTTRGDTLILRYRRGQYQVVTEMYASGDPESRQMQVPVRYRDGAPARNAQVSYSCSGSFSKEKVNTDSAGRAVLDVPDHCICGPDHPVLQRFTVWPDKDDPLHYYGIYTRYEKGDRCTITLDRPSPPVEETAEQRFMIGCDQLRYLGPHADNAHLHWGNFDFPSQEGHRETGEPMLRQKARPAPMHGGAGVVSLRKKPLAKRGR